MLVLYKLYFITLLSGTGRIVFNRLFCFLGKGRIVYLDGYWHSINCICYFYYLEEVVVRILFLGIKLELRTLQSRLVQHNLFTFKRFK